jgi:two-component system response regulator
MDNFNVIEILIVEDNRRDEDLTLRALKKHNLANNILVAHDGAEALDFFFCKGKFETRNFNNPPKLVLLDLKLPKVSGLEVRTACIPIVVVTSSKEEPDMQEAYKLGANSYVVKPVDFEQFINAMSSLGLYWLLINEPVKQI